VFSPASQIKPVESQLIGTMLASDNPYSNGFILLLHVPVRIKKVVGN